jgi:Holliday junction DNA helicase RuvA
MFYYLSGELAYREGNICVIDCGGVGYKLTVSIITADSLLTKLGKQVKLYTHLAVREDGIEMFGFGSNEEKECFNKLISVSGIGPKVALSILSTHTPEKLAFAIATDDVALIAKTPGIGKKTAQRIILELKDKLSIEMSADYESTKTTSASNFSSKNPNLSEATEALMVLGYDKSTILAALRGVDPTMDAADIIKAVLKKLAR